MCFASKPASSRIASRSGRFFFQADAGIRHHCVTGVQTCALPMSCAPPALLLFAFAPNNNNAGGADATYVVTFTVTDDDGGAGSSMPFVVTVRDKLPIADLSTS